MWVSSATHASSLPAALTVIEPNTWCFFDLDGTLLRGNSYIAFVRGWLRRHPRRIWHLGAIPYRYASAFVTGEKPAGLCEILLSVILRGTDQQHIDAYVPAFWETFLSTNLNMDMLNRLTWHHDNGHLIYIATSAFDFYVAHLKRVWPVDGVIATRAEWSDGVLSGRVVGKPCRGVEKMRRIETELNLDLQKTRYYAYSNNEADLPLLVNTHNGYLVKDATVQARSR